LAAGATASEAGSRTNLGQAVDRHVSPDGHARATQLGHGAGATPSGLRTFASLRHRDYRFLWSGTLFMSAGMWIQQVTMGWLAYDLTGSSVVLGALNGVRSLPFLVTSPIAGVWSDRADRRGLLLTSQGALVFTALGMGLLVVSGLLQVWHLFAFTLLTALPWTFSQTVRQAIVPSLVPKADLMNAVALLSTAFNSMKIVGPAVGGVLIAAFGPGGNFFVQSAAFGAVTLLFAGMHVPPTPSGARRESALANLKEGVAYVRRERIVLGLLVAGLVPNVFAMPVYHSLAPVFQKDVFQLGPEALGLLLSAPGIGAVISTLTIASVAHRVERKGVLLLAGLAMLGCSLIAYAQTPVLPLALVTLVCVGVAQMLFMSTTMVLLQMTVPDELRGRVMSLYMLDHGLAPLGALLAGISTAFVGAPLTVTLSGGIIILLAAALAWLLPGIRRLGE
jgi:MFS family permease